MRKELYKKVYEKYCDKYEKMKINSTGNSHFIDIATNLVGNLGSYASLIEEYKDLSEEMKIDIKNFVTCLKYINHYFRMLENNSDFRDAEMNSVKGYFPKLAVKSYDSSEETETEQLRIFGEIGHSAEYFVHLTKEKLEDIAKNQN